MGTLTLNYAPGLEDEVLRLVRILGATSISSRRPDNLHDCHLVMTVSGPAIPDRTEPTTIITHRSREVSDTGVLISVTENYRWAPGV